RATTRGRATAPRHTPSTRSRTPTRTTARPRNHQAPAAPAAPPTPYPKTSASPASSRPRRTSATAAPTPPCPPATACSNSSTSSRSPPSPSSCPRACRSAARAAASSASCWARPRPGAAAKDSTAAPEATRLSSRSTGDTPNKGIRPSREDTIPRSRAATTPHNSRNTEATAAAGIRCSSRATGVTAADRRWQAARGPAAAVWAWPVVWRSVPVPVCLVAHCLRTTLMTSSTRRTLRDTMTVITMMISAAVMTLAETILVVTFKRPEWCLCG
ncbi:hypothetical protein CCHR01_13417, partial [Colletotrichum chrysophilum]